MSTTHRDRPTEAEQAIQRVRAVHVKEERIICGARTQRMVRHSNSNQFKPPVLATITCTEYIEGHPTTDSNGHLLHKDGACCWSAHRFTEEEVYERVPRDVSRCSCGKSWPCETIKAIEFIEAVEEALS